MSKFKDQQKNMYSARIEQGGNCILAMEVAFYWAAATALTIATGVSLWGWDQYYSDYCFACNNNYVWTKSDDFKTNP
jgi:hypothetical protein